MNAVVETTVVVHLHEVLDHDLPVERHVGNDHGIDGDEVVDPVVGQRCVELCQPRRQRRRVVREVHEDEAAPDLHRQPRQADLVHVESVGLGHLGRADQLTVEVVDPVVVRAAELAGVAADPVGRVEHVVVAT